MTVECAGHVARPQNGTDGTVDVTVKPGETWTCTFNNSTNTGTVKVIKTGRRRTQVAGWTIDATNPSSPMAVTPGSVR